MRAAKIEFITMLGNAVSTRSKSGPPRECEPLKPGLFIVGAPKCGTTAWAQYLGSNPDIFISDPKEPSHFCTDLDWPGIRDRGDYLKLFENNAGAKVLGEASPRYLFSQDAARNIREFDPQAKIIILLRNQVEFLRSLHNQHIYNGMENIEDFEEAWRLSGMRNVSNTPRDFVEYKMLDYRKSGSFAPQIDRFLREFPSDQVRIFHFSDWTRNPRATYLEILRLLEVADDGRIDFPQVNEARRHAIPGVHRMLKKTPASAAAIVKKLSSPRQRLWLKRFLLGITARPARAATVSDSLRQEITDYYSDDVEAVRPLLWRPAD